ncbi:MAG: DNA repair protein [Clostridia bacterium]|nr:DNA repair protein [Clostridia bacterium]
MSGNNAQNQYLCIDLKSFFASVECVERGLDPWTTKLVVADTERSNTTICLAVTPALKAMGVKSRCRLYEIPKNIEFIQAPPRMKKYIEYSAEVYGVYLKYISKDDIHIYSIDEVFIDATKYLKLYKTDALSLSKKIIKAVYETTGIPAACGIGTNLYLAKIALDITAKKSPEHIGILDEESYIKTLWDHKPITDFWHVGKGTANTLARYGIYTMRDIAHYPQDTLYRKFGVDAEIIIDHAWGKEPTTIADIKNYKTKSHSFSSGQILPRDYTYDEGLLITKEMAEKLCMDIFDKDVTARSMTLEIVYGGRERDSDRGTYKFPTPTNAVSDAVNGAVSIYEKITDRNRKVRKISVCFNNAEKEKCEQLDFFSDTVGKEREKIRMKAINGIRKRYGKNSIFKGRDLEDCATAKERNNQIGGHKSGEK